MLGRDLQRGEWRSKSCHPGGLDGKKMSKSLGNYVALNDSPTEMFGKLMASVTT
jgi:tyrosyl-tRNA synthetase